MEPWFGNHGNVGGRAEAMERGRRASMEPWFGNHGNETKDWHVDIPDVASMEPWFGNHGNAGQAASSGSA